MNMISTGAFQTEMDASNKQPTLAEKFAAVWEKKNAKAARAGGVSLMALSLAACGSSDDDTSTATTETTTTETETTTTTTPVVDAPKTLALTTVMDSLAGGSGDDNFSGVVQANGATGTTAFPGDIVNGGDGTDTLTISVAGSGGGAYTISALDVNDVETVQLANFDTHAGDTTVDTVLMDGVTTFGLSSSSGTGDTIFDNLMAISAAKMANGSADLTMTYTASVVTGTADTQVLSVSNLTGGTFTADGTENLTISSSLAKSTLAGAASNALKTVTVTGDQNLTITAALDFASNGTASSAGVAAVAGAVVDASAFTGALTMTTTASEIFDIKGGSGADTFNLASLTKDDKVDGGAGDDTALITVHDAAGGALKMSTLQFSNLENFSVEATNNKDTSINADGTTVTNIILVENDTTSKDATVTNLAAGTSVTINNNVDNQDAGVFTLSLKDPAGSADALTVNLNGTSGQAAEATESIVTADIETINLVSGSVGATAMLTTDTNTLTNMNVGLGTSLNISGGANLTFTNAITGTKLTTVDASGLTGKLSIVGAATDVALTGGAAADTLTMGTTLTAKDTIDGGAGSDTLTAEMNAVGTADAYSALSIANVETVSMETVTAASFLNMAGVTGMTTLNIGDKNGSAGVATTISNLSSGTKVGLGGLATDKEYTGTVTIGLADETGSADDITFVLADTDTNNDVNATIKVGTGTTTITTGVESVTLQASTDGTANDATLDLTSMGAATLNLTKGNATEVLTLGTVNKNTTTIDASAYDGLVSVTGSASATTLDLKFGAAGNTITMGAANDTVSIADLNADDIDGAGGTDTLTATINDAAVTEASTNFETITYNIANNTQTTVTGSDGNGIDTAKTFTLTGGDALTTYAHDLVSPTVLTSYDMSGYTGKSTAITVAATARDLSAVDIKGSAGTDTVTVTTNNNNFLVKSMADVETLVINAAGGATAFDFTKTTGITTVKTDDDNTARDVTLTDLGDGVSVEITTGVTASGLIVDMLNKANAGNALSLKVKTVASAAHVIDIDVDEVEETTIYIDTGTTLDLAGLSMTTGTSTLKLTGDSAATISALHLDVTTVDASGMISGGSVVQTGRSTTGATTYTGSDGNDTFIMGNKADVIDGGETTGDNDTLDINLANQILGGIAVDLSATGDQVATVNGMAETTVQQNFESVDLAGYTGGNGAQITGSAVANTIVGTDAADTISGGAGGDTITGGGGNDVITLGTGSDTVKFTASGGEDTITSFAIGAGNDILHGRFTLENGTAADTILEAAALTNGDQAAEIANNAVIVMLADDSSRAALDTALDASDFDTTDIDRIFLLDVGTTVEVILASNEDTADDDDVSLTLLGTLSDIADLAASDIHVNNIDFV